MNKLQRYAELKKIIIDAENEINELKADVTSIVLEQDDEKYETPWGRFELRNGRPKWTYSPELTAKEKQVKEALKLKKKEEEIKGIAIQENAPINLVFIARKDK